MSLSFKDIEELHSQIMRLKRHYEQFFSHNLDREPIELRKEVEQKILRYTARPTNNTALQFRLNTVVATFNSYRQYWDRMVRAIEEGRLRKRAETSTPPARKSTAAPPDPLEPLYRQYISLRRRHQGIEQDISFDRFKQTITEEAERLKSSLSTPELKPKVVLKDGKVRIAFVRKKPPD